jgi:hypothetical protein
MPADLRRLSILTAQEIDDLYGLPRFTQDDRRLYFDLSASEHESVKAVRTTTAAVHLGISTRRRRRETLRMGIRTADFPRAPWNGGSQDP